MPGPNRFTEGLFEEADVTASVLAANGEVRYNIGDSGRGTGIDRSVQFWGIDGFLSRPVDPDANGAAQAFFLADGNKRSIVGTRDRRYLDIAGNLDAGDRVIYSPSGVRVKLDDSEQTIRCTVPGGSTFYLTFDQFRVGIASGAAVDVGLSTVDVTNLGVAENVALYATLQAYETAMQNYVGAVHAALLALLPVVFVGVEPPPPAPPGPLTLALNTALAALLIAQTNAANPLLASSAVLRASPT